MDLAARFRSPDFFAGEVALTASWGPLFAQGGFQLPAPWRIGGRPLQVAALTVGAGVQHPVELPSGELRLRAGVVAEAVEVRRLDLPWAEDHHHLDLGGGLGAEWRVRVFGSWVGLYLEGGGMPTARTIRLPEGAFAPLGRSWARLGLRVGWGR